VFRNDDGILVESAEALGLSYPLGRGRVPMWLDWDRDGRLDLLLTNAPRSDGLGVNALFRQLADQTFVDATSVADLRSRDSLGIVQQGGVYDEPTPRLVIFGAGGDAQHALTDGAGQPLPYADANPFDDDRQAYVQDLAIADFDGDLKPDVFVARSPGEVGLRRHSLVVSEDRHSAVLSLRRDLLLQSRRGGYVDNAEAAGLDDTTACGSSVAADFDNDGFMDIFVGSTHLSTEARTEAGALPRCYRNRGNDNHWLLLDLQGVVSNRDGVGARVFVETPDGKVQLREQTGGTHRWAQNSGLVHVGLGAHGQARQVTVVWPSGIRQTLGTVDANQRLRAVESSTTLVASARDPGEAQRP